MEALTSARPRRCVRAAVFVAALCGLSIPIAAQSLAARAAVSAAETEMGVPFTLQVAVDGSDATPQVELPSLDGVSVRQVSAGPNNSESITIAGGQTTRRVQRRYLINYELIASRAGRLEIPSMGVTVDGQRLSTQPLAVTVFTPPSIKEYRLLVEAAADRAWVGQPITLTTTWIVAGGAGTAAPPELLPSGDARRRLRRGDPAFAGRAGGADRARHQPHGGAARHASRGQGACGAGLRADRGAAGVRPPAGAGGHRGVRGDRQLSHRARRARPHGARHPAPW